MTTPTEGDRHDMDPMTPRDRGRTVGPREGLGAAIVALGVLSVAMPAVLGALPPETDAALVLAGMSVLVGIFVIVAGVMSFIVRD
jgi:hypothetical protein